MESKPISEAAKVRTTVLRRYDKLMDHLQELKNKRTEMEQRQLSMLIDRLLFIKQQHEAYL